MSVLNPQAVELNQQIKTQSSTVYDLLSQKGKAIYFPKMGILAQGNAAKGKEINATIGTAYEDDGKPMVLPSLADRLMLDTREAFPYAPSDGLKALRDKWLELTRQKNPSLANNLTSLPVVTCGVTHGLSIAGYLLADPGDRVIVSDLYWENYDLVYTNAYGANLQFFNLFKNGLFDTESFKATLTGNPQEKKIVVLNFPNNPSGYTPTKADGKAIVRILTEAAEAGNRIAVILDDSYFGLFFEEDILTESLFAELSRAHKNLLAVKVDGITKEEYAWGFRVGFITFGILGGQPALYKALEEKTAGAIRGNISNSSHPSQSLFLNSLKTGSHQAEKERNRSKILERYLIVKKVIQNHPEFTQYFNALPFNSGYFMCIQLKKNNAEKVWETLLNKYSTGVICYTEQRLFRIAFASTPTHQIEKLFNNIYLACRDCA
ncbi:MAG TPA: aminotransferase class I/II-fold pyridoxal phosphate-dependent enzyme [Dehalococcoidales bacterium]|nr:aminotransferase class I/II-fold pyridoxal phosphate-dependent enzyme [Dehalococcoidales bacterium]